MAIRQAQEILGMQTQTVHGRPVRGHALHLQFIARKIIEHKLGLSVSNACYSQYKRMYVVTGRSIIKQLDGLHSLSQCDQCADVMVLFAVLIDVICEACGAPKRMISSDSAFAFHRRSFSPQSFCLFASLECPQVGI